MTAYVFLVAITIIAHIFFRYEYIDKRPRGLVYGGGDFDFDEARSRVESKTIGTFFVLYIALLCLRDSSVGIDASRYISLYFDRFKYLDLASVLHGTSDEYGFSILSKIISLLTSSPQIYLAVIALISVVPVLILYRKEADDALLCCSFFLISLLFEAFFSALREGIAIGLVVPAYYFVKRKKIIPFILIVLLASTFHLSAIIILVLYPIYHAKITWKWLWVVVPVMFILYRYNAEIFNTLLVVFGGKYANKYLIYGYNATGQYGLLVLFVLFSVYSFVMLDEEIADKDDIGLRNILLLSTALQLFAPLHVLASRLNYYFILLIPIVISRVNSKCKVRFWQIAKVARFLMIAYFIFYFFFGKGDALRIMNYQFCF